MRKLKKKKKRIFEIKTKLQGAQERINSVGIIIRTTEERHGNRQENKMKSTNSKKTIRMKSSI